MSTSCYCLGTREGRDQGRETKAECEATVEIYDERGQEYKRFSTFEHSNAKKV